MGKEEIKLLKGLFNWFYMHQVDNEEFTEMAKMVDNMEDEAIYNMILNGELDKLHLWGDDQE